MVVRGEGGGEGEEKSSNSLQIYGSYVNFVFRLLIDPEVALEVAQGVVCPEDGPRG